MGFAARKSVGSPLAKASAIFFFLECGVHVAGLVPLGAMLLDRPKALITLRLQGDAALKFRRVKEAGPVAWPKCCLAYVQGPGVCAGRGLPDL
jgi:hypothetical protein